MNQYIDLIQSTIAESIATKQLLLEQCADAIMQCGNILATAAERNSNILFCGNGGSAADAQHLAAELVVRYRGNINRRAIKSMALTVDPSVMTAGGNDIGFDNVFARQVEAFAQPGDVLVGITTSGKSPNVMNAINKAEEMGVTVIGLLGGDGGPILPLCDYSVVVPSTITARVQESHILTGHIWCDIIERHLFPEMFK